MEMARLAEIMSNIQGDDNALGIVPKQIRTGRFIQVSLSNLIERDFGGGIFLAWTPRNGIPDKCLLLVPDAANDLCLSFKTNGKGWKRLQEPTDCTISFEIRFDDCERHQKGRPTPLVFWLIRKNGRDLKALTQAVLWVVNRCTKNSGNELLGIFETGKQLGPGIVQDLPHPVAKNPKRPRGFEEDLVPKRTKMMSETEDFDFCMNKMPVELTDLVEFEGFW